MHVGMSTLLQNLTGHHSDRDVHLHELSMADMAEPLGFDSIWSAEHHGRSALGHYEFHNAGLADIKGHEYYGTPEQCFEKLMEHHRLADGGGLIGIFSYGGSLPRR